MTIFLIYFFNLVFSAETPLPDHFQIKRNDLDKLNTICDTDVTEKFKQYFSLFDTKAYDVQNIDVDLLSYNEIVYLEILYYSCILHFGFIIKERFPKHFDFLLSILNTSDVNLIVMRSSIMFFSIFTELKKQSSICKDYLNYIKYASEHDNSYYQINEILVKINNFTLQIRENQNLQVRNFFLANFLNLRTLKEKVCDGAIECLNVIKNVLFEESGNKGSIGVNLNGANENMNGKKDDKDLPKKDNNPIKNKGIVV